MLNREERTPVFKLTIVQYAIVAILLVLLSGLWRLQVIGAQNYRVLAEQNRIRKVPNPGAAGQTVRSRRPPAGG